VSSACSFAQDAAGVGLGGARKTNPSFSHTNTCRPTPQYGGGKSTGFGLIYDNIPAAKQFEPKFRLIRVGGPDMQAIARLGEGSPRLSLCMHEGGRRGQSAG